MRVRRHFIISLLVSLFPFILLHGQTEKVDSLLNSIDNASPKEVYFAYSQLFEEFKRSDFEKAIDFAKKANLQAKKIQFENGIGESYNKIAVGYDYQGDHEVAEAYYDSALSLYNKIEYEEGVALVLTNLGVLNRKRGNTDKALDYLLRSLRMREELNDSVGIAMSLHNIGGIYYMIDKYDKAITYFQKSLKYNTLLERQLHMAQNNNNIGSVYQQINEYDKALKHYKDALEYLEKTNYEMFVAIIQDNIGSIYEKQGEYDVALSYHSKALSIHESLKNTVGLANTNNNIGNLYLKKGEYTKANSYLQKSLELAKKIEDIDQLYQINHSLSENYELLGRYKESLLHFKEYAMLKDSFLNENTRNQIAELETKYETEKKENQIQLQRLELERKEAELKRNKVQKIAFTVGLLLITIIVVILAIRYLEKRKTNKILAEKNKNITESITYARKIQSAVLPPEDLINKMLPEHFILYLPRDIVSGDFYWITRIDNKTIVAAADCTGHGVPGAFMSVLGFTLLNEVVGDLEELKPNLILNKLRYKVKNALRQEGNVYEAQDGIDIAICLIDQEKLTLEYSGAHNPMVIIKNGELVKIKGDRMPVGFQIKEDESFTNHKIDFSKGDMLYLYSDGYIDQFGGENGNRFKTGKFERILGNIYTKPVTHQKNYLEKTLLNWKGDYDQIDDILVMGIRLS